MNTMMSLQDFVSISPLLILLGFALALILWETFAEKSAKKWAFFITLAGLLFALIAAYFSPESTNTLLTHWLRFDSLSKFFTLFFLMIGIGATLLSGSFFKTFEASRSEYFFLLLSAIFGLVLIGTSADFLTLFLGIETLSLSLYVWCGYMKSWEISRESSTKYFLMGAVATAFLLYGIALVYGAVGTTRFDSLLEGYKNLSQVSGKALFLSGIALITLALAFEATIVPFQVWSPDVYAGASSPVTSFMAVGTKVGAFAAFVRVFFDALPHFDPLWSEGIAWLAYPTLIYANLVAIRQTQLRRFFAYSGISHAGFLLIPLAVGTPDALSALLFYLVVYAAATFGSFAVIAYLDKRSEGVMVHDLSGLFVRSPWLAGLLAICLLTLAGLPPTAGFFAKFYLFKVAFEAGYYGLVIVGLLMTIFSAYYYLRIIGLMFSEAPAEEGKPVPSWPAAVVGIASLAAIAILSLYPAPLLEFLQQLR